MSATFAGSLPGASQSTDAIACSSICTAMMRACPGVDQSRAAAVLPLLVETSRPHVTSFVGSDPWARQESSCEVRSSGFGELAGHADHLIGILSGVLIGESGAEGVAVG